jgi:hypothetical protein
MNLSDYLEQINNAFPVFSFGESYINEWLGKFPFHEEGIRQRWRWHDGLAKNILEFLNDRFPDLERLDCFIICDVRLGPIREKIRATEGEYRFYWSVVQKYSSA